jgi:hypothetical protein
MDKSHLNTCKKALYLAFLQLPYGHTSESEAEICFALSKDRYIQNLLNKTDGYIKKKERKCAICLENVSENDTIMMERQEIFVPMLGDNEYVCNNCAPTEDDLE